MKRVTAIKEDFAGITQTEITYRITYIGVTFFIGKLARERSSRRPEQFGMIKGKEPIQRELRRCERKKVTYPDSKRCISNVLGQYVNIIE